MQKSDVISFPWTFHDQPNILEPSKDHFSNKVSNDILPLKYNDEDYKIIEEKSSPVIYPAPFEHPVNFDENSASEEDRFIAQFKQKENEANESEATDKKVDSNQNILMELCDRELWDQFSRVGTEMIVTKTGRRMFPGYRIKISGLDPDKHYCIMMDIVNVDDNRYKFQHGEWTVAGRGEPHLPQRFFLHPDSPSQGSKWMKDPISFHKVKLTNSVGQDIDGKVVLNSMHRYQPRVHIVQTEDPYSVHTKPMLTFAFPQTVFITVTAYQNAEVTKLKIDNNPFAKGFRDDGARSKKPRMDDASRDYMMNSRKMHMDNEHNHVFQPYNPIMHHNPSNAIQHQPYTAPYNHLNQPNLYHDVQQWNKNFNYGQQYERFTEVYNPHNPIPCNPGQMLPNTYPTNEYMPNAATSTPQKTFYECENKLGAYPQQKLDFQIQVPDEKPMPSCDSGIGWSPSGSTDEETSFISVGGPENHMNTSFHQQTENTPTETEIINKEYPYLTSSIPSEHDTTDTQNTQQNCIDSWNIELLPEP